MSLIISCETKSNAWEGMSLASLSDWFQGFCVFLLRYFLKKQQPAFLMKVGWEEWEVLDLIIFLWKPRGNSLMKTVNPHVASESDVAVAVRRPKLSMKFLIHRRSECSNIGLKTPVFLSSIFPSRNISLEMSIESEMENRASCAACVAPLAVKPKQSELHSLCCQQSEQGKTILSLVANNFVYRLLSTLAVELKSIKMLSLPAFSLFFLLVCLFYTSRWEGQAGRSAGSILGRCVCTDWSSPVIMTSFSNLKTFGRLRKCRDLPGAITQHIHLLLVLFWHWAQRTSAQRLEGQSEGQDKVCQGIQLCFRWEQWHHSVCRSIFSSGPHCTNYD